MKLGKERRRVGTPLIDLIEEAIALLRRAPTSVHLAYYIGAVPFWIGLLYFVSDMSLDAFATLRVLDASLAMAVLYVWKKTWQAVSAASLRTVLTGRSDGAWNARRIWRVICDQAAIQPWGLILRPVAGVLTLPIVWVSAFFQNATVLGGGTEEGSLIKRSIDQSKLWPVQAHGVVSVISFFSFFVWLNFCLLLAIGPYALQTFFGVQTEYTRSLGAYLNTTYFTATIALTSLAVDPLRKALFVIRCFHGTALHTGDDLRAELRQVAVRSAPTLSVLAAALMLLVSPSLVRSADPPVEKTSATTNATELKRHIEQVLERREYAWRAPRVKEPREKSRSWIGSWFDDLGKKLESLSKAGITQVGRLYRYLRGLFTTPTINSGTGSIDWVGLAIAIAVVIGAASLATICWLIVRVFVQRRKKPVVAVASQVASVPDLRAENLVADQLPEDGWRELARDYAARGELVLAQRAAWLAGLAHLGHRDLIGIARYKSNREYDRELRRRARDRSPLLNAFDDNLRAFERSWYGRHDVSRAGYEHFEENLDRIRTS